MIATTNCNKSLIRYYSGDFIEIYRKCTDKPYSFLVIDTTLSSNNLLRFRKNLNIINDDDQ